MTTEDRPHVVYRKSIQGDPAWVFPNYALAHAMWKTLPADIDDPYIIATLGRVIDPAQPVIDVGE